MPNLHRRRVLENIADSLWTRRQARFWAESKVHSGIPNTLVTDADAARRVILYETRGDKDRLDSHLRQEFGQSVAVARGRSRARGIGRGSLGIGTALLLLAGFGPEVVPPSQYSHHASTSQC